MHSQVSIAALRAPERSASSVSSLADPHLSHRGRTHSEDDAHWLSTNQVPGQRPPRVTTSELAQLYAELGTLEKSFTQLPKSLSFSRQLSRKESCLRREPSRLMVA